MNERTQQRTDARDLLAAHVFDAIRLAMAKSPHPELVHSGAPACLVGIAGSLILTMARSGQLADGEVDKVLATLQQQLLDHADPSKNPPPSEPVARMHSARVGGHG